MHRLPELVQIQQENGGGWRILCGTVQGHTRTDLAGCKSHASRVDLNLFRASGGDADFKAAGGGGDIVRNPQARHARESWGGLGNLSAMGGNVDIHGARGRREMHKAQLGIAGSRRSVAVGNDLAFAVRDEINRRDRGVRVLEQSNLGGDCGIRGAGGETLIAWLRASTDR
jgi:hypothetical protein